MSWLAEAIRFYTRRTPIEKGRYRLAEVAAKLAGSRPRTERIRTSDGRTLLVDTASDTYRAARFTGTYEPGLSRVLSAVTRHGDVCVDAGANIGWHTTLLAARCGGSVHAFEPVPTTFEQLTANLELNGWSNRVTATRAALSDTVGTVNLHVFRDLPEGHTSISDMGRSDFDLVSAPQLTLDSYLKAQGIAAVDVIKIDVEGAELHLLKGASRLFAQVRPPIIVAEMAQATLGPFGVGPNDLLAFIENAHPYRFFVIDEASGDLRSFQRFPTEHIGANVLCAPAGDLEDRLATLRMKGQAF